MWESGQTAGPNGTKFGTHMRIHLGMNRLKIFSHLTPKGSPGNRHQLKKIRPSRPIGGILGVSWGTKFKSVKSGQTVGWTIINHITGCPLALPSQLPVSDGM